MAPNNAKRRRHLAPEFLRLALLGESKLMLWSFVCDRSRRRRLRIHLLLVPVKICTSSFLSGYQPKSGARHFTQVQMIERRAAVAIGVGFSILQSGSARR